MTTTTIHRVDIVERRVRMKDIVKSVLLERLSDAESVAKHFRAKGYRATVIPDYHIVSCDFDDAVTSLEGRIRFSPKAA